MVELWFRRVIVVAMVALVVVAAFGLLGPRERTTTVASASGELEVTYPVTTRPGLDAAITITLRPEEPAAEYRVRLPQAIFDELGLEIRSPQPVTEITDDGDVIYVFEAEGQKEPSFTWSGRVPTRQIPGRTEWRAAWLSGDTSTHVLVSTWVLP